MVDIDGVILQPLGPSPAIGGDPRARFHAIDSMQHFLSSVAAAHLLSLAEPYDLVRASGWEEKAEEYLPHLLGLPAGLPFLRFARMTGLPPRPRWADSIEGHWKLDAIDAYAGDRPLAWIDDAFDRSCHAWPSSTAPTLLVETDPSLGLTSREAWLLAEWALAPTRPPAAVPS